MSKLVQDLDDRIAQRQRQQALPGQHAVEHVLRQLVPMLHRLGYACADQGQPEQDAERAEQGAEQRQ